MTLRHAVGCWVQTISAFQLMHDQPQCKHQTILDDTSITDNALELSTANIMNRDEPFSNISRER